MVQPSIRFHDGDAYDRGMGPWSQLAGQSFLDWLAPRAGLRWLDVGCGTGAFTELLVARCVPTELQAIDPRSSPSRGCGRAPAAPCSFRATPWTCRSTAHGSTPP
jgi:hypothetical protein